MGWPRFHGFSMIAKTLSGKTLRDHEVPAQEL
jgi:hypothetical protein